MVWCSARQVPQLDWSRLDPAAKALLLDAAAGEDGDDGEEGEEVLEMRRRLMAELEGQEAGGRGDPRGGSLPGEMALQGGGEETEEEAAPARSTVMQDGEEELAAAHQQVEEMEAEAEEEEDEEGVEEEEDVMDMVDPAVLESVRQDHQLWGRILRCGPRPPAPRTGPAPQPLLAPLPRPPCACPTPAMALEAPTHWCCTGTHEP